MPYCWSTVVWEKPKRLLWFDCQAALWSGSRKQDSQSSNWWRPRGGFVPRKTATMPLRWAWRPWTQFVWARGLWNAHLQKKLAIFHCGATMGGGWIPSAAAETLCKSNLPAGHAQAWCRCRRGSFLSQPACGGSGTWWDRLAVMRGDSRWSRISRDMWQVEVPQVKPACAVWQYVDLDGLYTKFHNAEIRSWDSYKHPNHHSSDVPPAGIIFRILETISHVPSGKLT